MLTIRDILNAYDTIQRAKYEQELIHEQKKLKSALNEHYTCYNRCYYLKYSPEEKTIIENSLKIILEKMTTTKNDTARIKKILAKLKRNKIYWKLENKI